MSAATPERLARMVNQIAAEFANQQPGNAAAATAEHVRLFWEPRMIAALLAASASAGTASAAAGTALSPLAAAAVERLRGADAG